MSHLQEYVEERSIALTTRTAQITGRCLAAMMQAALRKLHKMGTAPAKGKQSVKQLSKGGPLQNIEITDGNIKSFEPFAKKFGIDYALRKDTSETPPKWIVFFNAKDTATMTAAFKAYSAEMMNKSRALPSVKKAMAKALEVVKNTVRDLTRNKTHGEVTR